MFKLLNNKKISLLGLALFTLCAATEQVKDLSKFNFSSASVLPFFTQKNNKYVILGREAYGISKRKTWDAFGGTRDKGENHPLITAAREFWEEANIKLTLGLTLKEIQDYIDIAKTDNTLFIMAHTNKKKKGQVTYITAFDDYKDKFIANFYHARKKTTNKHRREKDRIAIVNWENLKKAMSQQKDKKSVHVVASVIDPTTGKKIKEEIRLRSTFVKRLKAFMRDESYKKGKDERIRFYSDYHTYKETNS
jgi:8-oxo-dGTP pyrophosphatase MutT (NUDIX family)